MSDFAMFRPDAITSDLTVRLRRLADDLDRIAARAAPTAAELGSAPLLVDWRGVLTLSGLSLTGFVAGHPLLGRRNIITSPVWTIDPDLSWARTLSRFYQLGLPAVGAIPPTHAAGADMADPQTGDVP